MPDGHRPPLSCFVLSPPKGSWLRQIIRPASELSKYYVYIIRCADNSLYVGYSCNVHERFRCHEAGTGARYTANRRPLELVYFEEVDDEAAAKRRESQLKRWSHAKKQALVDGDTQRLRDLAKSRD